MLALCRVGLVLLAVLCSSRAVAQEVVEALRPEFPVYPRAEPWMPIADELFYRSYGMKAVSFRTEDPPGAVIPFFVKAFKAQNLVPGKLPIPDHEPEWVIVGIDPDRLVQKLVWAQPHGRGSFVMLALAPMAQAAGQVPDPAPPVVPPGCRQTSSTGSRDGEVLTRVITLTCDMPRPRLVQVYGEGMSQAGFQKVEQASDSQETAWRRGEQTWSVRTVEAAGVSSLVMVLQGRLPPAAPKLAPAGPTAPPAAPAAAPVKPAPHPAP
ncbi:MAG TPA: hypothetical protein VF815_19250 [Myxococcaceae bacterium]|jgi:hypothetical protein